MIDVHNFPFNLIFSFKVKRSFFNVILVFMVMIHGIVEGTFVKSGGDGFGPSTKSLMFLCTTTATIIGG